MKKKIIIIVLAIVLLIGLFFGYKTINYIRYTFEKPDNISKVVKGLKNQKTITVNKKELPENEYIKVTDNIKMKNIFDGYTLDENGEGNIVSYKKEGSVINFEKGELNFQMIDAFVDDEIIIFADLDGFKGSIKDADRKGFLEKHNIKNDIDFYKFAADNYFIESNFFTDTKTLKQNYAFNLFASIILPEIEGWTIIEGDFEGLCLHAGTKDDVDVYEISIIKDGKRYAMITNDPRFKDESFMIDLISSFVIE